MQFDIGRNGATVTVRFDGQLNFFTSTAFEAMLAETGRAGGERVVFDLSGLTRIDSVGLGLLYIAKEDLEAAGRTLSLASPRGNVAKLLELTDARVAFEITP
jgi:anti-anti-sigma factor